MSFSKLGLTDQLVQGILATGYTAPTEIQTRAIPFAVAGRDVIGCAQTGTGKTAAFVLPILNRLTSHNGHAHGRMVRALVLTPTRELAQQVDDFVTTYGRFTTLQSLAVFGGVSMENQLKHLRRGVDIVIATPGRLLDHINRRSIDLSHVEVLVLDEADRMFDMGFINDVRTIISKVPAKRQTLLFSATMSKEVKALVSSVQHNPELIEVGEQQRPVDAIRQTFYTVEQDLKLTLLLHILQTQTMDSVLVFSRTKHGADKISRRLERTGIKSVAIHANRTQAQRQRALAGFKQGQYTVLVATDIAARGIDVEGISHVINFDTPAFAEDYIHRIGRTGRASLSGDAITFVSGLEKKYLRGIEQFVGVRHELKRYPGFDYVRKEPATPATTTSPERSARPKQHARSAGEDRTHRRPHQSSGSGQRPQRSSGGERSGQDRRNDQRVRRPRADEPRRKQQGPRVKNSSQPAPTTKETDWRKLMEEGKGERDSFRKKLKRLFKKD